MLLWTLVLSVVALCSCNDSEWREFRTPQGAVRGRKDPDGGLYVFYNIPYATIPAGTDRYKAPLPAPVWLQPIETVDKGIICLQPYTNFIDTSSKTMQEDCLIANVYVPDTEEKNLPVMVFVHGGGFEIGYGDMTPPKAIVKQKKLVAVTFNYRLGVHGFLCLGSKSAPGNAGFKDQIALLRWVKKNIASYGGNPNDVTIIGGSAGSMSVSLLTLSKAAEGLFAKAIPESGVAVASVAVQHEPLENAKKYAKMLNFTDVDDFYALEEFYKNTPLKSLLLSTFGDVIDASLLFAPCVERESGNRAALNDAPINIIKKNKYKKVPVLSGISNNEGLMQMYNFEGWSNHMNNKFSDFIPSDLFFENEEEKELVAKKVKEFYFGDQPVSEETSQGYIDYVTDVIMAYPTYREVKVQVEAGHDQIYLYEYSFVDDNAPAIPFTKLRGATHCAQTTAVLDGIAFVTEDESSLSQAYKQMKATIRELWGNFVVHGKPVPESSPFPAWPAAGADGSPHMILDRKLELRRGFFEKRVAFWEELYQKYYKAPVPPPQPPPERHTEL